MRFCLGRTGEVGAVGVAGDSRRDSSTHWGEEECRCGPQVWEQMQHGRRGPIEPVEVTGCAESLEGLTAPHTEGGEG